MDIIFIKFWNIDVDFESSLKCEKVCGGSFYSESLP